MFRLAERAVARCLTGQARWKGKTPMHMQRDRKKARTTSVLKHHAQKIQQGISDEIAREIEEEEALALLQEKVPLMKNTNDVLENDGRSEPDAPSDLDSMTDSPVMHYVIAKKTCERSKHSILMENELMLSASKPPSMGEDPYVQIRSSSGNAILGYGLWKGGKKRVYVVTWLHARRGNMPLHKKNEKNFKTIGIGRQFWFHKFYKALEFRQAMVDFEGTECFTFINGDGDGCPGLVVDLYSNAAAVTITDTVALSYLKYLLEYLQTRTPTTVIHITSSSTKVALSSTFSGYYPKVPQSGSIRVVMENGLLLTVPLEDRTRLLKPAKATFRDAVMRHAAGKRMAILGDVTGSCVAYALKGGCVKVLNVNETDDPSNLAPNNVKRNFYEDEATHVKSPHKGMKLHFPELTTNVKNLKKTFAMFGADVEQGAFDCMAFDLSSNNPRFDDKKWVEHILMRCTVKLNYKTHQGGTLMIISNFSQEEVQSMLRNVAENTNLEIRLVEPLFPAATNQRNILSIARPVFGGWVVNVRA